MIGARRQGATVHASTPHPTPSDPVDAPPFVSAGRQCAIELRLDEDEARSMDSNKLCTDIQFTSRLPRCCMPMSGISAKHPTLTRSERQASLRRPRKMLIARPAERHTRRPECANGRRNEEARPISTNHWRYKCQLFQLAAHQTAEKCGSVRAGHNAQDLRKTSAQITCRRGPNHKNRMRQARSWSWGAHYLCISAIVMLEFQSAHASWRHLQWRAWHGRGVANTRALT